ncbi:hypothetical protein pb186bvf_006443 [Paramecium bursaria]
MDEISIDQKYAYYNIKSIKNQPKHIQQWNKQPTNFAIRLQNASQLGILIGILIWILDPTALYSDNGYYLSFYKFLFNLPYHFFNGLETQSLQVYRLIEIYLNY